MSDTSRSPSSEVLVEKLVPGGYALGRIGPQVVFVPGGVPGERLRISVGPKVHGVHHGKIRQILASSPDRVEAPCSIYGQCGGCQLQHIRYDAQLMQKKLMLGDALGRIGKMAIPEIESVWPSPQPFGYRRTIRFAVFKGASGFHLGFYQAGTHRGIDAHACLLIPEHLQQIAAKLANVLVSCSALPMYVEHIELRSSITTNEVLIVFHGTYKKVEKVQAFLEPFRRFPDVVGCMVQRSGPKSEQRRTEPLVVGQDYVTERFGELTLHVGFQSFMQTNWPVYEAIGKTLKDWLGDPQGRHVLELYARTGALGMSLARHGAFVTLVESNPCALADAKQSMALSRVARCTFKRQAGEKFLTSVKQGAYEIVLLDPPRTGLSATVTQELGRIKPDRIFYISCDMATLARDLSRLVDSGYGIVRIQPFDMFPQTAHLETLVELRMQPPHQ
ncbi:MAG: 23S rRNA (uracil(1939)-C(5))-methyltransferase RlmD [Nitrospirales bacterium]|nr:23S rRNA (uracil(1939)-C(5))-methyltransferase RlmD [Nitrospira sp.]MDR4499852.1 23S rRNA (uracil(1939)-C(5))-methyltransferase RlmD [Nitrospirales bacterium]